MTVHSVNRTEYFEISKVDGVGEIRAAQKMKLSIKDFFIFCTATRPLDKIAQIFLSMKISTYFSTKQYKITLVAIHIQVSLLAICILSDVILIAIESLEKIYIKLKILPTCYEIT